MKIKFEVVYLILRSWGSVKSLLIESLNIIKLHDSIVVFTPPPLSLPFIKHLPTSKRTNSSNVSVES